MYNFLIFFFLRFETLKNHFIFNFLIKILYLKIKAVYVKLNHKPFSILRELIVQNCYIMFKWLSILVTH
jgi:hypothetical protein